MTDESYSEVEVNEDECVITIHKNFTHIKQSNKKYVKINGQTIYSGNLHYHTRVKLVNTLRKHLSKHIPKDLDIDHLLPLNIEMEWHTVPNFETVKFMRASRKFIGGKVEDGVTYDPAFDVDNQWIWIKVFTDALTKDIKIVDDDTVKLIPSNGKITYVPVESFDERKLVFRITRHSDDYADMWERFFGYEL